MACPGKWKHGLNLRSDSWWFHFDPYPCELCHVDLLPVLGVHHFRGTRPVDRRGYSSGSTLGSTDKPFRLGSDTYGPKRSKGPLGSQSPAKLPYTVHYRPPLNIMTHQKQCQWNMPRSGSCQREVSVVKKSDNVCLTQT